MPITSSAKKALRSSKRKRVYNLRRKDAMSKAIKSVKNLVADAKKKEAAVALSIAFKALDKAAKTNYIKKNTASRLKSRLSKLVSKI